MTLNPAVRKIRLTGCESFWYVCFNIALAAGYFAKIPAKKALVDFGFAPELTGAERFWYVCMNLCLGAGYLAKVPVAKVLSETPQIANIRNAATFQ